MLSKLSQPTIRINNKEIRIFDVLFPEQAIYARKFSLPVLLVLLVGLTAVFAIVGKILPANGFIGFDWVHFFGIRNVPVFYPPWDLWLITPLTWQILIGLTLAAVCIAAVMRSVHPISAAMVLFCLPVLWTVFLGQLDGIVTLGLLYLPWLAPLALAKPQVSIFAFGAKRSYLIGFAVCLIISMLIWGAWPLRMMNVESYYAEGRYQQNIGMGMWGLPLTLITLWFSRGDMDMLMASGVFLVPHLIPYNLLPLTPAVARLRPKAAILAFVFSWLPFSANWLGPIGWWLGWIFVAWIWLNLAASRYPGSFLGRTLGKL